MQLKYGVCRDLTRHDPPEEFFTVHFVQFAYDVLDSIVQSWNDDVFDSVHSPIGRSNDLVEYGECGLE